jgi:hypothetical protein
VRPSMQFEKNNLKYPCIRLYSLVNACSCLNSLVKIIALYGPVPLFRRCSMFSKFSPNILTYAYLALLRLTFPSAAGFFAVLHSRLSPLCALAKAQPATKGEQRRTGGQAGSHGGSKIRSAPVVLQYTPLLSARSLTNNGPLSRRPVTP